MDFRAALTLSIFISACSSPKVGPTPTADADCLGPRSAKNFAVYLHGQDRESPSLQEQNNRKNLAHLADILGFRIALPRASMHCPNKPDLICWAWKFNEESAKQTIPAIESAAKRCFANAESVGLIGFSSGGYLVNQIFQHRLESSMQPRVRWILSIGSSFGGWKDADAVSGFSNSVPLTLLVGKDDKYNHDPKDAYFNFLKSHGGRVQLRMFDGGHDVPDEPLIQAVESLLQR